jgi:hypothetical protein
MAIQTHWQTQSAKPGRRNRRVQDKLPVQIWDSYGWSTAKFSFRLVAFSASNFMRPDSGSMIRMFSQSYAISFPHPKHTKYVPVMAATADFGWPLRQVMSGVHFL